MMLWFPRQLWSQFCLDKQRTQTVPAALLGRWPLVLPGWVGFELLLLSAKGCRDFYVASGLRTCSRSAFRKATDTQARTAIRRGLCKWSRPITRAQTLWVTLSRERRHEVQLGNQSDRLWGSSLSSYLSQAHSGSKVLSFWRIRTKGVLSDFGHQFC